MYMCTYLYICIYVYMDICFYGYMDISIFACKYAYVRTFSYVCTYLQKFVLIVLLNQCCCLHLLLNVTKNLNADL